MKKSICAITLLTALTGCASIINGTNQIVSLETHNKGQQVSGATCKLENSKGTFYVTSPGTVTIKKAYGDMAVKCEKESHEAGLATVKSGVTPLFFGNILLGGLIGMGVDIGTGAGFDYPTLITIPLGQTGSTPSPVAANDATAPEKKQ